MSFVSRLAVRLGVDAGMLLGALTLTVVIGGAIVVFGGLASKLFAERGETVKAAFSDTMGLWKQSEVRVDGIEVGKVKKVTVNRGGRSADVELEVFKDGLPLYADATAAIRWRLVLGGTVVVDIDRGTPASGQLRPRVIPLSRTVNQVELDPLISVFRGGTKAGLRTMLRELPPTFRDRRYPARTFYTLADVSPSLERGIGAVRGEVDGDLRRLISNTAATVRALDRPDELRGLVEGAALTLEATARREADLRRTIALAARVQPRTVSLLRRLDRTLTLADPLIDRLQDPADDVAPTAQRLRPVLVDADRLLQDARPLLHSLRPAATSLADAARVGVPFLREIEPSINRLEERILPGTARPDPFTGLATHQVIGPALAGFAGGSGHFDNRGYFQRFPAGGSDVSGGCAPGPLDPDKCQTLLKAIERFFEQQP